MASAGSPGDWPMRTARLVLRPFEAADAPALAAYRDDPHVARHQDWHLPFTLADAEAFIAEQAGLRWPAPGEWLQVAVEHDGDLVGDVGVGWTADGSRVSLGYTLATAHQGRGFATEAAGAVVDRLFADGVHRVVATLDPENVASMRVVEALGFTYEGRHRASALVRGEWLDDDVYGLLAGERAAWLARDRRTPASVELVPITPDIAHAVGRLATHHSQERLVAPVSASYADALFPEDDDGGQPVVPWYRAIEADGVLAGFVMITEATATSPDPYLWRLLVDRWHQGRGIGRRAVEALIERARADGHPRLLVSYVPGPGSPQRFYERLGFVPTGEVDHGEVVAALDLRNCT